MAERAGFRRMASAVATTALAALRAPILAGALVAGAIVVAPPLAAQRPVPTITLDKGAREFTEPFSQIIGIAELRDGRVLVSDSKENEIRLIDFASGSMTSVSGKGSGPLEFQLGALLSGAADSSVFYDFMQRRFLLFSPTGVPVRTALFGSNTGDPMAFVSMMQPTSVDASGRVYGQGMGMSMLGMNGRAGGAPGVTFADTVAIQRFSLRTGRTDTIARIRNVSTQVAPKIEMGANSMRMTMSAPNFDASDEWTVFPDGTVAILRDGDYRVQFVSASGVRVGPPVPHTAIPVTAAMRRAMVDSTRAQMQRSLGATQKARTEAGNSGVPLPKVDYEVREPARWATHMAPYASLRATPDGKLWVGTPRPGAVPEERASHFDVLDRTGVLVAKIVLVAGERLVGLGRGVAYTIRTDADDLQYLRRHALP